MALVFAVTAVVTVQDLTIVGILDLGEVVAALRIHLAVTAVEGSECQILQSLAALEAFAVIIRKVSFVCCRCLQTSLQICLLLLILAAAALVIIAAFEVVVIAAVIAAPFLVLIPAFRIYW
jgi:hypothetical protein